MNTDKTTWIAATAVAAILVLSSPSAANPPSPDHSQHNATPCHTESVLERGGAILPGDSDDSDDDDDSESRDESESDE